MQLVPLTRCAHWPETAKLVAAVTTPVVTAVPTSATVVQVAAEGGADVFCHTVFSAAQETSVPAGMAVAPVVPPYRVSRLESDVALRTSCGSMVERKAARTAGT